MEINRMKGRRCVFKCGWQGGGGGQHSPKQTSEIKAEKPIIAWLYWFFTTWWAVMKPRLNAGMFLYTQQNQENSNFTEMAKLFQATKQLWFYCLSQDVTRQRSPHTVVLLVTTVKPGNYTGTISFVFGAAAFAQQNSSPVVYKLISLWQKRFDAFAEKITDVSAEKKKASSVMCVNGCSWHTWTQER